MIDYVVKAGDCLSSIAHRHGYTWQALWNDSANAALRALRVNPSILFPGDVVRIRDKTTTAFPASANTWNRFTLTREIASLRLRVRLGGEPLADANFTLAVDGAAPAAGTTDGDGRLEMPIPPDARHADLRFANGLTYRLEIGGLDPLVTPTGLQARLAQLGYYAGPIDGIAGPMTRAALSAFQMHAGIPTTGEPNAATRDALKEAYGC